MGSRPGSDKETAAVSYNLKHRRVLENRMYNLSLEEARSLKLLDINHQVLKVNYKRLKDRVSRISSFLTAEEIEVMSDLESKGKLKTVCGSPNLASSLKIRSAEKCLKLNASRPQTSASFSTETSWRDKPRLASRSRSVAGLPTNFHEQDNFIRNDHLGRPKTAFETSVDTRYNEVLPKFGETKVHPLESLIEQPSDSNGASVAIPSGIRSRAKTAPLLKSHTPYNCHESPSKQVRTLNSAIASVPKPRSKSAGMAVRASIDSNLGSSVHEERKMQLLRQEAKKGEALEGRKSKFLRTVRDYIDSRNCKVVVAPTPKLSQAWKSIAPKALAQAAEEAELSSRSKRARRKQKEGFKRLSEEEYRKKVSESWTNLTKCRYLRVPTDKQDLTGYNTLVKDQLLLLDSLRRRKHTSFLQGVQVT